MLRRLQNSDPRSRLSRLADLDNSQVTAGGMIRPQRRNSGWLLTEDESVEVMSEFLHEVIQSLESDEAHTPPSAGHLGRII